jgi:hypothetical protein
MATAQMDMDMDRWIDFCAELSPFQNFLLLGLLSSSPDRPLGLISPAEIQPDEHHEAAEEWASSNLRRLLLFYCEHYQKVVPKYGVALANKADIVKQIVPLLVSTLSVPVSIAVAFLFWALGHRLDEWCKMYARRHYTGKGLYSGNFPEGKVEAFFDIFYLPPITRFVDDPEAYPLKGCRGVIKVKPQAEGKIKVANSKEVNSIVFNFDKLNGHRFEFTETTLKWVIKGIVENVFPATDEGSNVLGFTSTNIEVPSLSLTTN